LVDRLNIVILAGTKARAINVLAVIDEIHKRQRLRVIVVDLDKIYFQKITRYISNHLTRKNVDYKIINYNSNLKKVASSYSYLKRLILLMMTDNCTIRNIIQYNPHLIITGGDNYSERYFIDSLFNVPAFLISDGLSFRWPTFTEILKLRTYPFNLKSLKYPIKMYLFKSLLKFSLRIKKSYLTPGWTGHNNTKKIFVIGKWLKDIYKRDGVSIKKIIITGVPNFINLTNNGPIKKTGKQKIITFMTGAYREHSLISQYRREQAILSMFSSLIKNENKYKFQIKIHPNDNPNDFEHFNLNKSSNDLINVFQESSYIVTSSTSTTIFEGIYYGCIPVIITTGLNKSLGFDWLSMENNIYGNSIIKKYKSVNKFFTEINKIGEKPFYNFSESINYLNKNVFYNPKYSSHLIANEILKYIL
jgi:hypothetical protein